MCTPVTEALALHRCPCQMNTHTTCTSRPKTRPVNPIYRTKTMYAQDSYCTQPISTVSSSLSEKQYGVNAIGYPTCSYRLTCFVFASPMFLMSSWKVLLGPWSFPLVAWLSEASARAVLSMACSIFSFPLPSRRCIAGAHEILFPLSKIPQYCLSASCHLTFL